MKEKKRIAIIGASIAGCAAAALLDREGHEVTVFERRGPEEMAELGAGIVLPTQLIHALQEAELLGRDFPYIPLKEREFWHLDRKIGTIPMDANAVHWGVLYQQLARRLPRERVHYHQNVTQIEDQVSGVKLTLDGGRSETFDRVLCADGYHSLGRKRLFPDVHPQFTQYTCWQGVYESTREDVKEALLGKVLYYVYEKGVLLVYEIPPNHVSWFFYEVVDDKHPLVRDRKAHLNLYQADMAQEYRDYMSHLAERTLPPLAKEIVQQTPAPFTHAIYDTLIPEYVVGKIALIGDAGILLRPHLGSGATKALQDALAILECETWEEWGETCQSKAAHLFGLSRAFGDFLVERPPHWQSMDHVELNAQWNQIVSGYKWYQHR